MQASPTAASSPEQKEKIMSTITRSDHRSAASAMFAAGRAVADFVVKAVTLWQNRRAVERLVNADPAMLRDLGLTPMDVSCALAEPFWRDPSARLLIWTIERRAAHRAIAREVLDALGERPDGPFGGHARSRTTAPEHH
jgi:uncharacterized protein YjiS (DUF1127 family)